MQNFKAYLLTGLIIVVPVFLTIYALFMLFSFFDGILGRLLAPHFVRAFGFYPPGVGFFLSLVMIMAVGFTAKRFLNHRFALSVEKGFSGLPLIRYIYPAVKQVVVFLSQQREIGFKKVVMVEYPRKGMWSLGFLTNEQFDKLNRAAGRELVSVFVSTTPGPLTGSVFFFPREEVLVPEISLNEAVNIIISGGVFKGENPPAAGGADAVSS